MTIEKWFERGFDFTLPVSRYPMILERLRGTPGRLAERVSSLDPDVLVRRAGDQWSIQENVGHLVDLEVLWTTRVEEFIRREAAMTAADLTNRRTHEAGHNDRAITDLLREFRAAREGLLRLMEQADDAVLAHAVTQPRLGTPMRLLDFGLFAAEHDDHHLAAITQLRRRWGVG